MGLGEKPNCFKIITRELEGVDDDAVMTLATDTEVPHIILLSASSITAHAHYVRPCPPSQY